MEDNSGIKFSSNIEDAEDSLLQYELSLINQASNLYRKWLLTFFPQVANDVETWKEVFTDHCTKSMQDKTYDSYVVPTSYDFLRLFAKKLESHSYVDGKQAFTHHIVGTGNLNRNHPLVEHYNEMTFSCHCLGAFFCFRGSGGGECVGALWDRNVYNGDGENIGHLSETTLQQLDPRLTPTREFMVSSIVFLRFTMPSK